MIVADGVSDDGTTAIVATPHANPQYKYEPDVIEARLGELRAGAPEGIEIYRGCDFHLSFENIQDAIANPRKYAIHNGPYMLVEFSDLLIFHNTSEIFDRLQNAGMMPVITHPERNSLLRQRLEHIAQWVERGASCQVTAGSLLGHFVGAVSGGSLYRKSSFLLDSLGKTVRLSLTGGGLTEMFRTPVGDVQSMSLVGAVPRKSVLTFQANSAGGRTTYMPPIQGAAGVRFRYRTPASVTSRRFSSRGSLPERG